MFYSTQKYRGMERMLSLITNILEKIVKIIISFRNILASLFWVVYVLKITYAMAFVLE